MPAELALDAPTALLLFGIGALASGLNAVAGGGSLISFPVLVGLGIPPVVANATNAVGLWPGSIGGGYGFRSALAPTRHHLRALALPTLLGSGLGAWLLLATPETLFDILVPVLILAASILILVQPSLKRWSQQPHVRLPSGTGAALQFAVAVYGGYFGAGMGILMLAAYSLYMEGTIHEMNAVKTWLGLIVNFTASAIFLAQGYVLLLPGAVLASGAVLGGFLAARASMKVDSGRLRVAIGMYGLGMAGFFGARALGLLG